MQNNDDNKDITVGFDGQVVEDGANNTGQLPQTDQSPEVNNTAAPPAPAPSEETKVEVTQATESEVVKEPEAESQPSAEPIDNSKLAEPKESAEKESEDKSPDVETVAEEAGAVAVDDAIATSQLESASKQVEKETARQKPENRNNKKFAAVFIVLIAFLLAGGAVFVYLTAENNTEETTRQSSQQDSEPQTPATGQDVDQAAQDVDEAIEAIDDTDIIEDDLSDESLGL